MLSNAPVCLSVGLLPNRILFRLRLAADGKYNNQCQTDAVSRGRWKDAWMDGLMGVPNVFFGLYQGGVVCLDGDDDGDES